MGYELSSSLTSRLVRCLVGLRVAGSDAVAVAVPLKPHPSIDTSLSYRGSQKKLRWWELHSSSDDSM